MKRQAREVYGFGQRFPTRNDRAARLAQLAILAAIVTALAVLAATW